MPLLILICFFVWACNVSSKTQNSMPLKFKIEDFPANPQYKENYVLEFSDDFEDEHINPHNWYTFYLPQWSSRERSKPQYELKNGHLILKITQNQEPWCPEFNGEVKCSSIQTGVFAGELGSSIGQHKFNPQCVVRESQENGKTYLPQYGYFEIRAKSLKTKSNVVALWMIGYEDQPERSAEICIFEVKGWNVSAKKAKIGFGIHKFNDPKLKETFFEENFALDATQFHIYAAEWTPQKVSFFIDNQKIKEIEQAPDYPMQLMLGIYELPTKHKDLPDQNYPKDFVVDYVRGYRLK
jgi:hypothetical protein